MPRVPAIQIHPTRRCNLECLHCYSSSGPRERGALSVTALALVLEDAARLGYAQATFSGGEPLLYSALPELLGLGKRLGMFTSLVSNGLLLHPRKLAQLQGSLDLLAISLDGTPPSHDRNRNRAGAFAQMAANLRHLRASGIPFGFVFTLTRHNLAELEWVANFALEQGARQLQVHLLAQTGRAMDLGADIALADDRVWALAAVDLIQHQVAGAIQVDLDAFHVSAALASPQELVVPRVPERHERLADVVPDLVVEADGTVVPVEYGFDRCFALGNIVEGRLVELAADWLKHQRTAFAALTEQVYREVVAAPGHVISWPTELRLASAQPSAAIG